MKTIFKRGDKVFDYAFGWGEVISIDDGLRCYPITVRFNNETYVYTLEGSLCNGGKPTLSFTEYTLEGFSQERLVTFEEGEFVAVSFHGKIWRIEEYVSGKKTIDCDGDESEWNHIKKLTDFNK
jgi:hypothetical protein